MKMPQTTFSLVALALAIAAYAVIFFLLALLFFNESLAGAIFKTLVTAAIWGLFTFAIQRRLANRQDKYWR